MGKLNVVLDWFGKYQSHRLSAGGEAGYFAERAWEVHIDGEVHGVMDLHGADFVLGPQISMLDCMVPGGWSSPAWPSSPSVPTPASSP